MDMEMELNEDTLPVCSIKLLFSVLHKNAIDSICGT